MQIEDQSDAIEFLRAELARIDDTDKVRTVETHISLVLIARSLAWKLKKAVRHPYLDFSTAEQRLAVCERELVLNRRTAPQLYRSVRRLVRGTDGRLALDGEGALVDAVLEMACFDDSRLLDRLAQRGELTPLLVTRLAAMIVDFHAGAGRSAAGPESGSARVEAILRINEAGLETARDLFGDGPVDDVVKATSDLWQRHRPLMDERQRAGGVRLCHGDLHLRNIVEIDGQPVLFDCLEFDEEMATTDVLYDLAFLLMDLWHRDLKVLSNLLFNRYLDAADETEGLPLLPLFLAMRATVRAHVLATQALEGAAAGREAVAAEARAYLDLAQDLLSPRRAQLTAIGGFSGSGKSTMAAAIAHGVGAPPGARVLCSDRIRKRLFGVDPETRLPQEAYHPDVSAKVYALQRDEAARVLAGGQSVIADAVFGRPEERAAIEAVARKLGAPFRGIWLEAPEPTLVDRIAHRRGDPSDATADVLRAQMQHELGMLDWLRVDTTGGDAQKTIEETISA
ncbi:MAG: bifunctional aminoglycoside phosphotransferase/ATP-binding protein [Rhizobiaceae bacterium]